MWCEHSFLGMVSLGRVCLKKKMQLPAPGGAADSIRGDMGVGFGKVYHYAVPEGMRTHDPSDLCHVGLTRSTIDGVSIFKPPSHTSIHKLEPHPLGNQTFGKIVGLESFFHLHWIM